MSPVALTAEQADAVARRAEPLLLSAAAGSGKTSVLVQRFVAAVRDDGIAPARILAITFTERAAGELRARVRARLLELGDRQAARDTEAAFVGTFHGFCARLLRAHPLAVGLDPAFTILDEGLAGRVRESAFALALPEFLHLRGPSTGERAEAVDLLAAYRIERVRAMIERAYAELRSRGERLPRLPAPPAWEPGLAPAAAPAETEPGVAAAVDAEVDVRARADAHAHAAQACRLLDELLHDFGLAYERLKRARRAVDFDDLELLAGELLSEREAVRAAWSERFDLLMVDEFQDTNARQLGILAALDRGNLFTVGDELQSIYGFRHADVRLFRERREQLRQTGASLRLTRNFRSREAVLAVVNATFGPRFPDYSPLLAGQADAEGARQEGESAPAAGSHARAPRSAACEPEVELLLTDARGWEERDDLAGPIAAGLPHAQLWRQAEARMLAQRVAELVHTGRARAGEVVVLLRAAGDLDVFERALQLAGLRTLAGVGAFWGHQQIADLIAYLRALANPLDEVALYEALASPLAGCSMDCLALLAGATRAGRRGVWETALAVDAGERGGGEPAAGPTPGDRDALPAAGLAAGDRDALASFCEWFARERAASPRRAICELLERAIDARGYRTHVLGLDWPERRMANVHKLLRLARRFEASEGRDLRGFLDHVEYLRHAVRVEPDAPVEGAEPDAVRLMTIHAAKGLEFPVVCVADLGRQPNAQTPDLLVDGERVGLRLVRLDGARSSPALDYEALCRERLGREVEEEDRILYVAMTRARERLLLSGALDFARWPASRQGVAPIAWLAGALSAELPALAGGGDVAVRDLPIGDGSVSVRCRLNTPATVGTVLRVEGLEAGQPAGVEAQDGRSSSLAGDAAADGEPAIAGEQLSLAGMTAEREERAPAARDQPLASTLSYTALSELERCGYRYYLERVLGLPEQFAAPAGPSARPGLEARARGTLVHRLMESLDFARPGATSPERVAAVARELGMRVGSHERAEIAGLIAAAGAAPPAARVAAASSVRREHPFAFSTGADAPLITGVIDLLAQESDGGYLVLDFKSDRVGADTDLAALVEEHYAVQRELYALAVLRAGAPSVEVVHWFLERPREWVAVRYGSGERDALQARLAARITRACSQPLRVSPRPHAGLCRTCPGRAGLCSWGDAETLREIPVQQPAH
jgi:ATP-dependent helicase/nuclease subunit A